MKYKNTIKRSAAIVVLAAVLASLYLALGTTLPYIKPKAPSDEAIERSEAAEYFGDGFPSGDKVWHIKDNDEALQIRIEMISMASEEIVLATYEFFDDESGRDVLVSLWDAAERGVKVRLILDGYNHSDVSDSPYFHLLAGHENAEIKIYNPVNVLLPWKAQSRMHEKYLICDKKLYLIGGRNTNDRFLGDYQTERLSLDREILVFSENIGAGSASNALYDYFEMYWELEESKTVAAKKVKLTNEAEVRFAALKESYPEAFDGALPENCYTASKITLIYGEHAVGKKSPDVWYQLFDIMSEADESVIIQSPYIMCDDGMYEALSKLSSGGDVSIIINSPLTGSNLFGGADYLFEKDKVLSIGASVHEYSSSVPFHTKTILIDDSLTLVGSFNLDMRSCNINSELMLAVDCEELNSDIRNEFEFDIESSRTITPDGNITDGDKYIEFEQGAFDKVKQWVIGVVTRPIRYLL